MWAIEISKICTKVPLNRPSDSLKFLSPLEASGAYTLTPALSRKRLRRHSSSRPSPVKQGEPGSRSLWICAVFLDFDLAMHGIACPE